MERNTLYYELGLLKHLPIVDGVLDLVPLVRSGFPTRPPAATPVLRLRFEPFAELFEVSLDGGVGVYVYSAASKDHPQLLPLGGPALYVLAAQVGLYDLGRARVLAHEPLLRGGVDQERLVQAGLYTVERLHSGEFGEGDAVLPDFLHQIIDGSRLEAPGALPEALLGDCMGIFFDVGSDVRVQRLAGELDDSDATMRLGLFPVRFLEEDDAGEHVGVLEDRGVSEVYDLFQFAFGGEVVAQRLAVAGPQPLVGDDVAHPPATPELPEALLVEVHVEVGGAMVDFGICLGQVGLEVPERFLADVGRVAHHSVEAGLVAEGAALAVEEDFGELELPVEEALLRGKCFGLLEPAGELGRGVGGTARSVVCERLPERAVYLDAEVRGGGKVGQVGVATGQALAQAG